MNAIVQVGGKQYSGLLIHEDQRIVLYALRPLFKNKFLAVHKETNKSFILTGSDQAKHLVNIKHTDIQQELRAKVGRIKIPNIAKQKATEFYNENYPEFVALGKTLTDALELVG